VASTECNAQEAFSRKLGLLGMSFTITPTRGHFVGQHLPLSLTTMSKARIDKRHTSRCS
jgi:hypothetical protein